MYRNINYTISVKKKGEKDSSIQVLLNNVSGVIHPGVLSVHTAANLAYVQGDC